MTDSDSDRRALSAGSSCLDISGYPELVMPYAASTAVGMMRPAELKLLFKLARDVLVPDYEVVDAGAFIGASTLALASGFDSRPDANLFFKKIHSYDRFVNSSEFYSRFLHNTVPDQGSFLPIFLHNTEFYSGYINVYPGEFARLNWIGKRIGLFFCDIAKSPALNAHVYLEYAPFWVPNETLFVQQDFVHIGAPWVQVTLGFLADHFEPVTVEIPSLLLRLTSQIPGWKLQRIAANDFSVSERRAYVARLAGVFEDQEVVGTLELISVALLQQDGQEELARHEAAAAAERYGSIENPYFRARLNKVLVSVGLAPLPNSESSPTA